MFINIQNNLPAAQHIGVEGGLKGARLQQITLKPGMNKVASALWDKVKADPIIAEHLSEKRLEEKSAPFKEDRPTVEVVLATGDVHQLKEWLDKGQSASVTDAIRAQLMKLDMTDEKLATLKPKKTS